MENGISDEVFTRNDYWRSVSPEVLLGHPWTEQSFIWTFALFFYQLVIHGKRPNRIRFSSLMDFLNADAKDDPINFSKTPSPSSLANFMGKCLQFNPECRPTFTEMINIINSHFNRCKIINFFNHF
jgi:serine/threonine protein kinase